MTRQIPLVAVAVLTACSSAPSTSTPALTDLAVPASIAPGSQGTATFDVSNAAGLGGLTLQFQLIEPGDVKAPPVSSALMTAGVSSETAGAGGVIIGIPSNAPAGTYGVSITVSDGTNASNTLMGTFVVP